MKTLLAITFIVCLFPYAGRARNYQVRRVNTDTLKQSILSALLTHYYDLKDALANSDGSKASVEAGELLKAINEVDVKSLSEDEKNAFTPLQPKLAFDARHISEVNAIEHQREHFASLSLNMYKLARATRLSTDPVYEMYCPMKKTYWLSKEETIKNPYYGKQMPSCGKITGEIK